MNDSSEVLSYLKKYRKHLKISQAEIADQLNMSTSNYRKLESGGSPMSIERFINVCNYIHVSPHDLLGDQVDVPDTEVLKINLKHYENAMIELKQNEEHLWGIIHKLLQIMNPKASDQAYQIVYPK